MEAVAQNAVGMGNICFSEKRQSNKWVAGELQQQQQQDLSLMYSPGERVQGPCPGLTLG